MRFVFFFLTLSLCVHIHGQSCDLDDEDFTGTSNTNPPSGWIIGSGTNIGPTVPVDPIQDPAVGFNTTNEGIISDEYTCVGQVCFDWHASSAGANFDVEISISQDMTNWTSLAMIITNGSNSPTSYAQFCVDIPPGTLAAPFLGRIKWEMTRRSGGTFYLENICISSTSCTVAPSELRFSTLSNQCREPNQTFSVTVCATDSTGIPSDTFSEEIVIAVQSGPSNITGTLTQAAVNGCAEFVDISLTGAGKYTLIANSDAFETVSDTIEITAICPNEILLNVMSYNLLNFPNGRSDCGSSTVIPSRWDTLEKIVHYYLPDVLMVCELQNQFGADKILNESLNSNGFSNYAAANFVINQSTSSTDLNNMFYYNQDKLTLYSQSIVTTDLRDISVYTVFANDNHLAQTNDTLFIDFYMAHLKAGSSSSDMQRRSLECNSLRAHLDSIGPRNTILGGDLNLYTSSETAYQTLLSGQQPLFDPIDVSGAWNNNFTYRMVHTQSTRSSSAPSYDCGAGGGCDSRFDFLLISEPVKDDSMNLVYNEGTYEALGNDGSIFNLSINDTANTSTVPDSILDALFYMSDHLPVVAQFTATLSVPECPINLIVSDTIGSGNYYADLTLAASGIINASDSVIFQSECIQLNSVFEVELGAAFEVKIGGCE